MRVLAFVLVVLLFAAGATFALLNLDERVDIHLPGLVLRDRPQALLVFASLAAGAVVTGLIGLADGARLRLANRRLRREINRLRQQGLALLDPVAAGASQSATSAAAVGRAQAGQGRNAASDQPATHPVIPAADPRQVAEDEPPYGM